jgi:hypothetical protein
MAEADGALYVVFMGTKQRRDLVANAQVMQDPVWPQAAPGLGRDPPAPPQQDPSAPQVLPPPCQNLAHSAGPWWQ